MLAGQQRAVELRHQHDRREQEADDRAADAQEQVRPSVLAQGRHLRVVPAPGPARQEADTDARHRRPGWTLRGQVQRGA